MTTIARDTPPEQPREPIPQADAPVAGQPIADRPRAEQNLAAKPIADRPAKQTTAGRPADQQLAAELIADRSVDQRLAAEPTADRPTGQRLAAEPTAASASADQHLAAKPTASRPTGQRAADQPTASRLADQSFADQPGAGRPLSAKPIAESFGDDPERYNRARPAYPRELIDRIVGERPGRSVLDVGCGTGIAARQFQAAGCEVTGVEPDARMAAFAAERGLHVEIAKFEDWDPAGRTFDTLTAGMTWHWVDPVAGAAQAARVVRPGGRIALFWNAFQLPPELATAFAKVYADLQPEMPTFQTGGAQFSKNIYAPLLASTAERLHEAGFDSAEQWRDEWQRTYTTAEWVDLFPTFGGHALLPRKMVTALQEAIGAAVDAAGGEFTVEYATVTVTAVRAD